MIRRSPPARVRTRLTLSRTSLSIVIKGVTIRGHGSCRSALPQGEGKQWQGLSYTDSKAAQLCVNI